MCNLLCFTAPKMVIYDNACSLHNYALNRDPIFFKDTEFYIDRLHWANHTGNVMCCSTHSIGFNRTNRILLSISNVCPSQVINNNYHVTMTLHETMLYKYTLLLCNMPTVTNYVTVALLSVII